MPTSRTRIASLRRYGFGEGLVGQCGGRTASACC